ncbi:MAG TPA: plastocyanin/azurin family copper-binding protein [Nitrososphaera sp.]|nr:plastocyanin/azurin family copper-binding protein [Nitrososphaera sp.]
MANHAGGIAMIAFIVALAVSMSYYQFFYIPQANAKPILPEEVINPPEETVIEIVEGSSLESNPEFFVDEDARATIGINNRVVWENMDTVPHTVTTDNDYVDAYSGLFDTRATPDVGGGFVMPGETYEFLFTKVGEYPYHGEPHPWMQGSIEIIENFA